MASGLLVAGTGRATDPPDDPRGQPAGEIRRQVPGSLPLGAAVGKVPQQVTDFGVLASVRSIESEARPGEESAEDAVPVLQ
ncbi:hypothetical protein ACFU9W_41100, partial [Streptomyces sp. NPDC057600]|uniref:hypothetical protein n=1 Tax=Streptomyces sp. NPDC057600 TaxID=3346180 RepID=UPI0036A4AAED